jgi:hypothetical protein
MIDLLSLSFRCLAALTIPRLHVSVRFMRDPEGKPLSRGSIQKNLDDPRGSVRVFSYLFRG